MSWDFAGRLAQMGVFLVFALTQDLPSWARVVSGVLAAASFLFLWADRVQQRSSITD